MSWPGRPLFTSMGQDRFLKIDLNAIYEGGRELPLMLDEAWFARWREEDPDLEFSLAGPQTGRVHLAKYGKDVLVRGHLEGKLKLVCSRCLEPYIYPVQADFDLLLAPGPEPAAAEEEELTSQDLDLDFYSGETIDLESILKEQIILMLPLKPLCAEACQGLCPRCGANLNQEPCACAREKLDSPFGALARLKK